MFRSVNTYPYLVEEVINGNPQVLSNAQLEGAALPILDRLYARELKTVIMLYNEMKPRRATTDLPMSPTRRPPVRSTNSSSIWML
jgi:hypothetical protein